MAWKAHRQHKVHLAAKAFMLITTDRRGE